MKSYLIAISQHSQMLGGGEHSFIEFLSLIRDRWNPLVVIPAEGELSQRLTREKIEVKIIAMPSVRPWNAIHAFYALKAVLSVCRKTNVRLIYANGTRAVVYGGIVARFLKKPLVWHCRVAERDNVADRLLASLSTKIVVNSHATAKRFPGKVRRKVSVIHNSFDLNWLRKEPTATAYAIREGWKVILTVGRISRLKRHDLTLAAFEEIAGTDPALHLVCVGDQDHHENDWWRTLQKKTRRSHFADRIHWIGKVDDVRPWYRASSLMVLASDHESFGRVLVEAMAVGLPIVATRVGGIPEIVRHGIDGLLVPPGKAGPIAHSMKAILTDTELRRRLAASGRMRADFFDRNRLAERTVELLNGLAADV